MLAAISLIVPELEPAGAKAVRVKPAKVKPAEAKSGKPKPTKVIKSRP